MATSGRLMYGQAGEYDALDDRMAISVAMQGTPGLWVPPVLRAAPRGGTWVEVGGATAGAIAWAAGIAVGDATLAVAASSEAAELLFPAGGSEALNYDVWLSASPGLDTWQMEVLPDWQAYDGRGGISLGEVTVPANANSAAEFDYSRRSLSSMGSIRNYRNWWERQFFEKDNPYRAWGSLTGLAQEQVLDVLWNNEWYTIQRGQHPKFVQSGWASDAGQNYTNTEGFGYFAFQAGDPPLHHTYSFPPQVFLQTIQTPTVPAKILIVTETDPGGFWWRALNADWSPANGPAGTGEYVQFFWMAVGVKVTGGV